MRLLCFQARRFRWKAFERILADAPEQNVDSDRLRRRCYETHVTPFGYLNEWEIDVHGESLAKVWRRI